MEGIIFITFSIGTLWLSSSLTQSTVTIANRRNKIPAKNYRLFFIFLLKELLSTEMFQSTVSNTLIIAWLYIYCYFGNSITVGCERMAFFAYESKFYDYPLKLRMFTHFIIARAQQPVAITGFKITVCSCSLESFSRVSSVPIKVADSIFD